jgi:hypothetical protein
VVARGGEVVPVFGARSRERLDEALGALDLGLAGAEGAESVGGMAAVAAAGDVAGDGTATAAPPARSRKRRRPKAASPPASSPSAHGWPTAPSASRGPSSS